MIATNFSPTSRPPSMQAVFATWARSGAATRAGLVLALTCSLLAVQPARADLLLRYTFDETDLTNTPALDGGIAPAANGTFVNKATRTTNTPSGTGLALDLSDGISDWVSVGNPAKLNGLSSFTLACWLNLQADPAANDRLMEKQGADGGLGWRIITPTTGTISATNLRLSLQFALVAEADTANLVLATNQWIFLALTYDSTLGSGNAKFYRGGLTNAAALFSTQNFTKGAVVNTTNELRIGSTAASTADRTPSAWFDDVRIYNTALSGLRTGECPRGYRLELRPAGLRDPAAKHQRFNRQQCDLLRRGLWSPSAQLPVDAEWGAHLGRHECLLHAQFGRARVFRGAVQPSGDQ